MSICGLRSAEWRAITPTSFRGLGTSPEQSKEAARLENGNTLISNWCPVGVVDAKGAKATSKWPSTVQLLEVTPDKKIVWALRPSFETSTVSVSDTNASIREQFETLPN